MRGPTDELGATSGATFPPSSGLPPTEPPPRPPGEWGERWRAETWLLEGGSRPATASSRRRRQRTYLAGLALESVLMALFGWGLSVRQPAPLPPRAQRIVLLTWPELNPPLPPPPPRSRPPLPAVARAHAAAAPLALLRPLARPRPAPQPWLRPTPRPLPPPAPQPLLPAPQPTLALPLPRAARLRPPAPVPDPVKLGAFGSPLGPLPQPAQPMPIAHLGSFAAAAAGAARPASPVLTAASGFGDANGAAAPPAAAPPATGAPAAGFDPTAAAGAALPATVRLQVFDPPPVAPPGSPGAPAAPPAPLAFVPPRILAWTTPAYTAAASRNHIEGEVVLKVRLRAAGGVEVLALEHGLGFGLDQAAAAAARRLQFRPALRRGQPVDWTVLLRIRFRLAN